ncbi:MAG: DUF2851 family protein [Flavobacteriaceae bacterium]|uniref:DUF2851 family protein n=1 Tax=Flavobacterium sp. UBA6195 TaxID=1946554 RepID=UPI000FA6BD57|nr:DUF2851 family protein [Flavobacterium sp. UBA6195]RTL12548.1 MAG: DUF2851 family protein [Flavobacteriaceae bacterium]TXI71928.1 MAG: DUF2851 family protein [Flavobacterium sp.]
MKEDFLHHVWQFKKFDIANLKTTKGESIQILNSGQYLQLAGPDFFNAQLIIGNQKWAGNVEIHLKSSDWYVHNHEKDSNYDSVILHVVWEYDVPIFRKDNSEIPTVELKEYVALSDLHKYQSLVSQKSWIYCENELQNVDNFIFKNWQERLFFERLERKSQLIFELVETSNQDWEAVLFYLLAKNFGLNTNGELFFKVAKSIPFHVIRKESFSLESLEALLLGQANLLSHDFQDSYAKELQKSYAYLVQKYQLQEKVIGSVEFFKHRPDNFPTIRLAQLANLYFHRKNLFSLVMNSTSISELYQIFNLGVSKYWETHYNFDKESSKKMKKLSKSFIDLLVINTIIPLRFAYARSQNKEITQELIDLATLIPAEQNVIIEKFKIFGLQVNNVYESQALLELKKNYCDHKKCLDCTIGHFILKK